MKQNSRSEIFLKQGEKLDENLLCQICQELLLEPQECASCQSLFCKDCIHNWIQKKNECPLKCIPPLKIQQAHRFIKNALSQIKFHCCNFKQGCVEVFTIEEQQNHNCPFDFMKCTQNCGIIVMRSQLDSHLKVCQNPLIITQQNDFTAISNELQQLKIKFNQHEKVHAQQYETLRLKLQNSEQLNEKNCKRIGELEVMVKFLLGQQSNQAQIKVEPIKYCCPCSKELVFIDSTFYLNCLNCHERRLIRYYCEKCKSGYCAKCKKIQIQNERCPNQHPFFLKEHASKGKICDFCYKNLGNLKWWRDEKCDMDVCLDCYELQIHMK